MKFLPDNPITEWWLSLDSSDQYMYWIITFCILVAGGMCIIIIMPSIPEVIVPLLFSIGALVIGFMFVVLWLTIRWPHIRHPHIPPKNYK